MPVSSISVIRRNVVVGDCVFMIFSAFHAFMQEMGVKRLTLFIIPYFLSNFPGLRSPRVRGIPRLKCPYTSSRQCRPALDQSDRKNNRNILGANDWRWDIETNN
jgi:hypothetical protein